ncbi:putative and nb-arc domain protein [Botrytis cinerea BcDW1]|uniref:Putative and nb-arc domain protein n=1 Tax=Botryotinia fuckeliana (strain BcDW1) TaxID=1290391 RepID=M7UIL9_BOTF1|nr:putative and nb-arc domain protein [Botrytis cinerea BcDW1]
MVSKQSLPQIPSFSPSVRDQQGSWASSADLVLWQDGSAINPNEINRFEVTEVYAHPQAEVDIVLVHGLNGHPQHTWTAKNGIFWPTALLPVTFSSKDPNKSAKVRILVYGYNADVVAFAEKSASHDRIHEHAQSLVSSLALERKSEEAEENPIIWVAHSLGGILVKRALEISHDYQGKSNDEIRSIAVSTFGIIFLGTPHTGADPAKWGLIFQGMVSALMPKKAMDSESILIKTLTTNNETLANINLHFLDIYQRFKICMAHESLKTDFKGTKAFIVDQTSASPLLPDVSYFGIEATHSGMCKYESKRAPGYMNVSTKIKTWALEASPIVRARWRHEKKKRADETEAQIRELRGQFGDPTLAPGTPQQPQGMYHGSSSSLPQPVLTESPRARPIFDYEVSEVEEEDFVMADHLSNSVQTIASFEPDMTDDSAEYFIKPPGFRPNSIFVGRREELAEMHKMLFDEQRRSQGSCAVLIQSMPGGGKTHLARQYAFEYRHEFPGGVFWIRAKSKQEITAGFWQIARKAALKPSMVNEDPKVLDNPDQFIKLVKKWLNHRHHWLLILDGMHFDDSLRRFIPDSINTSIIYTSTEKSVSGDHHFMNPQVLKLPALSAREAQHLLLRELNKREPYVQDDLRHSMELVQAMQFLPVVIHVVAQRLKATDEPLAKYARSYASAPKGLRELQAFTSVVEQLEKLGAYETLNLIRILCFFSQHLPVEMIALGLDALDVPIRASEPITGRSLNNTFKVLNKFALIDRNEHEASLVSSQTSKGSRDLLSDDIDVIRLHSVVQGFFVDTLHAKKELPMWLDRAISVFCYSFEQANDRITQRTRTGLVEDYRLYEIHGMRLQSHLERHKKEYIKHHKKETLDPDTTYIMLDEILTTIRSEIQRRTPESSHVIAGGQPEAFQTSIFDRTGSSSDTGADAETPADKFSDGSPWVLGPHIESPTSLVHDPDFLQQVEDIKQIRFPPQLPKEDTGYDSELEGSTMTLQPPKPSAPPAGSPESPGGPWEVVKPRRPKVTAPKLNLHRTIRAQESRKYRNRADSFRSMTPGGFSDPRVTSVTAHGELQQPAIRPQSRGTLSGQSSARVALAHISKSSPPPVRGGGPIQNRRAPTHKLTETNLITRTPTYASAVSGPTRDTASRHGTEENFSDTTSNLGFPEPTTAVAALQRISHDTESQPPPPQVPYTRMPPYPHTPDLYYRQPYAANMYDTPITNDSQDSFKPIPNPFETIFPIMTGPPPMTRSSIPYTSLSPSLKRDLPHDYPSWDSQSYPNSLHGSMHNPIPHQGNLQSPHLLRPTQFQSISSPNLLPSQYRPNPSTYYPGRPEFSHSDTTSITTARTSPQESGYTSQPLSRNPSGQSTHSTISLPRPVARPCSASNSALKTRRTSLAETEPLPQLPFSPRVSAPAMSPQIGYQISSTHYLNHAPQDRERGMVRKSPRLSFARTAVVDEARILYENQERERDLQRQGQNQFVSSQARIPRTFNPLAPNFSPRMGMGGSQMGYLGQGEERRVGGRDLSFIYPSPELGGEGFVNGNGNGNLRGIIEAELQAPPMTRGGSSGSGGLVVGGGRVVEFGDLGTARLQPRRDFSGERWNGNVIEFGETGLGIRTGGDGGGVRGDGRGWYGERRSRSR